MNCSSYRKPPSWRWRTVAALIFATLMGIAPRAQAADDSATILKKMSDYLASQKNVSLKFDTDIEVITSTLQKLQFTSSGQVLLNRPDKLRVTRTGGYADAELVFDGKTATILGKNLNVFAQLESQGSIDQLINKLNGEYSIGMPGADLLMSSVFDELMEDVSDAKHIGRGVIDGIECEHLAFRNEDTDWQIWIEIGPNPIPRKYVITSKAVNGAPQYTLRIKDWKTDVQIASEAFAFRAPTGAKKVNLAELSDIDELPRGVAGGKK